MEQNSGQETPDEINRRLSFGDHDSLPETVAKATSDAEMAQEAGLQATVKTRTRPSGGNQAAEYYDGSGGIQTLGSISSRHSIASMAAKRG